MTIEQCLKENFSHIHIYASDDGKIVAAIFEIDGDDEKIVGYGEGATVRSAIESMISNFDDEQAMRSTP